MEPRKLNKGHKTRLFSNHACPLGLFFFILVRNVEFLFRERLSIVVKRCVAKRMSYQTPYGEYKKDNRKSN